MVAIFPATYNTPQSPSSSRGFDSSFDIRNFTDRLTHVRDEKYICPVCNNNNLSISNKTGAYQCWNGCENKDIREAVSPWVEKKTTRPRAKTEYVYHDRSGKPCIKVTRLDDGEGHKRIYQSSWNGTNWEKGLSDAAKKNVPIYRYREIREAIAQGKPIFMVEGEGVADCLWNLGIAATTTLGGGGKYRKYGSGYKQDLEKAAMIVLCPDRDEPGLRHMEDIAQDFPDAAWLYAPPSDFYWNHLPHHGGLDVKDWVESGATAEQILEAMEDRRIVVESLQRSFSQQSDRNNAPAKSKTKRHYNLINAAWGERLRFNELTQKVELDGEPIKLNRAWLKSVKDFDIDISAEKAIAIVLDIAEERSYSPVRDYLSSVAAISNPIDLDNLAYRYFGTSDPLHAAMLKRTLIAAVARVFQPGCKVDTLTILQGAQGTMKSTFWRTLTGDTWFTDNLNDANEKDEKLKLRRYWLLEFSEFETAYKRKEVEQLKAFLSSQVDSLRPPYGREVEDFPRTSIFVGTTNRQEFLHDPTGERRYWVIPVAQRIPIEQLREERDRIWAAAVQAYRQGERWWLTPEEDALLVEANQGWQASDSWESVIVKYLSTRSRCTIGEVLEDAIKIDTAHQGKAEQMRVADILRRNNWMKCGQKKVSGKVHYFWEPIRGGDRVVTEVVTEVVTALKPDTERLFPHESPPVTTFSPNFPQTSNGLCNTTATEILKSLETGGGDSIAQTHASIAGQGFKAVTTLESPPTETPLTDADIESFADLVRYAIAYPEAAEDIKEILTTFFANNPGDKRRAWLALSLEEQSKFKALLEKPCEPKQLTLIDVPPIVESRWAGDDWA